MERTVTICDQSARMIAAALLVYADDEMTPGSDAEQAERLAHELAEMFDLLNV